jgi:hypothetical protein
VNRDLALDAFDADGLCVASPPAGLQAGKLNISSVR